MWLKKILNVNIINFEKVDKPEGGGLDNVDKVILLNLKLFYCLGVCFVKEIQLQENYYVGVQGSLIEMHSKKFTRPESGTP